MKWGKQAGRSSTEGARLFFNDKRKKIKIVYIHLYVYIKR